MSRGSSATSLFRPLALAFLALALFVRIGPLCEPVAAAPPTHAMDMAACDESAPAPAQDTPGDAEMSCLTPCATLAPEMAQVTPAATPDPLAAPSLHRTLAGVATAPDVPPPRRG